jgi:hypothetical protein
MGGMEKTTVYLTASQKAALARAAAEERRSEATLIREGVDAVTGRHRAADAPARLRDPDARPAAASPRPRWIERDAFVRAILRRPSDPGLRHELRELAPDTTDELPL